MSEFFDRLAAEEQRYKQMAEIEKQLGVSDPELEAIDDAIVRHVADALEHCDDAFSNLKALGAALAQPKPEEGQ